MKYLLGGCTTSTSDSSVNSTEDDEQDGSWLDSVFNDVVFSALSLNFFACFEALRKKPVIEAFDLLARHFRSSLAASNAFRKVTLALISSKTLLGFLWLVENN